MKNFIFQLIFLSFFGAIIKLFLPKGERSPLHAPLKFLLSLALILCTFSPILSLIKKPPDLSGFSFPAANSPNGEEMVLNRMEEILIKSIRSSYPKGQFSLRVIADQNMIPKKVEITSDDPVLAQNISDYIKIKFALECMIL